jgi:hypothetical protein
MSLEIRIHRSLTEVERDFGPASDTLTRTTMRGPKPLTWDR